MTALRTLRRAHDRLVICAETSEDWALVREMDAAIEQVAKGHAHRDGLRDSLVGLLDQMVLSGDVPRTPRPLAQEGDSELAAANWYGEMEHPVCQEDGS